MSSRREQKEQARAQREELAHRQALADQRRRRLMTLLGIAVAAGAVIAIVVAVSSGGSKSKSLATGKQATATVRQVSGLLAGIPQSGNRLGAPSARVTMTYFGDLECPVCRDFTLSSLPQVIAQQVRSGKLQIVYRALETATPDAPTFQRQQAAALAAGRQNRMWQYVELFYHEQGQEGTGYATDAYLTGLARQVPGLDVAKWSTDRQAGALLNEVRADATAASVAGASATPTLVIKGPKGSRKLDGLVSPAAVTSAVAAVS
jgi:protein-disulfide isomerase